MTKHCLETIIHVPSLRQDERMRSEAWFVRYYSSYPTTRQRSTSINITQFISVKLRCVPIFSLPPSLFLSFCAYESMDIIRSGCIAVPSRHTQDKELVLTRKVAWRFFLKRLEENYSKAIRECTGFSQSPSKLTLHCQIGKGSNTADIGPYAVCLWSGRLNFEHNGLVTIVVDVNRRLDNAC